MNDTLKISIASARVNANMKQSDVAYKLGVSLTTVCNWETGKTKISGNKLQEFCDLVNIPIEHIFLK